MRDGVAVRPAKANSSTSGSTLAEVAFISSDKASVARLTTNSPVASTLVSVSLRRPWLIRPLAANITAGGESETPLKKLKGARLAMPSALTVEIQPMGRGTIRLLKGLWGRPWPSLGS